MYVFLWMVCVTNRQFIGDLARGFFSVGKMEGVEDYYYLTFEEEGGFFEGGGGGEEWFVSMETLYPLFQLRERERESLAGFGLLTGMGVVAGVFSSWNVFWDPFCCLGGFFLPLD